jgi:hypothetical protein
MAQSGFTPLQLYRSTTPGAVPLAGNLAPGELALNLADEKLFFENAAGTVVSIDRANGTVTSVGGTGTVNGITLTGAVTASGNLTLGGTLSNVSLTSQVTGTLPIANGGTGSTSRQEAMDALAGSVTAGRYLRGNGTDVVMSTIQVADVPTLNQNTTGTASGVTNTIPVGLGGTGNTATPSNGQIPIGNGANYTIATLTAGNNTAITNAAGSVTVGAGVLTTAGTTSGTLVAADAFKQVKATGGVTLPVNFAADQYVYIRNTTGGNITVTQGGGLTLRFAALTGNRTLAQYGFMTVLYISVSEAWVVGGVGVT